MNWAEAWKSIQEKDHGVYRTGWSSDPDKQNRWVGAFGEGCRVYLFDRDTCLYSYTPTIEDAEANDWQLI